MKNDLLTSLRKYRVTDKKDPIENFITEAFAWLLKNYPSFSSFFIKDLKVRLNSTINVSENLKWDTQKNFGGVYPDMVCEFDKNAFVFEHKAWSELHTNQLQNYRSYAKENYSSYYLILITAHETQHKQNPDLALCWYDVYKIIGRWLHENESESDNDKFFLFLNFQNLLVHEGMGPAAPISHNSILSYYSARGFVKSTLDLITKIFNKEKEFFDLLFQNEEDYELINRGKQWGRFGLSMLKNWNPGIFVGFMIDGEDHKTTPIYGERSPDFTIILSFNIDFCKSYHQSKTYKSLVSYLENEISKLNGWNFYHHIEDDNVEKKNYWHPIHIRKPMIDLFEGTITAEDQEKRFIEATKEIIPIIIKSKYYQNLKNDIKKPESVK